jgi:dipeptidyl aminopeptidase/acylaminoacyl peptidase
MRIGISSAAFGLVLACVLVLPSPPLRAADTPVEAYGKLPAVMEARMSPDGTKIAAIVPSGGSTSLTIHPLDGSPDTIIPADPYSVSWISWKNDNRLIAHLHRNFAGGSHAAGEVTRLAAIDSAGKVTDIGGGKLKHFHFASQGAVIDLLPNDPNHIIINTGISVEKVDINDGSSTTVELKKLQITRWISDFDGNIRLGIARAGKQQVTYVRNTAGSELNAIDNADPTLGTPLRPISFSQNPNVFYSQAVNSAGFWSAYEYDIAKKSLTREVASLPDRDAELLVRDGKLVGFIAPSERAGVDKAVYLDPAWEHDVESINHALPDTLNLIIDRAADGKRVLILARSPQDPGAYYILDRHGPKAAMDPLGELYPQLGADQIVAPRAITFSARDGLTIHGYVTLPKNTGSHPVPFVVLPHDGPKSHDGAYFGYWAEFLVNRGYGVLEVEYRGSTGYGSKFEQAGSKQWGLAMQDDVTDGTKWIIDQNLADPKRICIMGAGYGGYSALMGAVREPDLYRCAVSYGGIFDLTKWETGQDSMDLGYFDIPTIDSSKAHDISPLEQADHIQAAVLLLHGRMDTSVAISQTEAMEAALKRAGKPVQAIYFDDEDHFLSQEANRIGFLKAVERFLSEHLGAKGT